MSRIATLILAIIGSSLIGFGLTTFVSPQEWNNYKMLYNKNYPSFFAEASAKFYYGNNKLWIDNHNLLFNRGQRSYKLKENQFTDMHSIHFNALFPTTIRASLSYASPAPPVNPAPVSYDPIKTFGLSTIIENQGTKCNSGWAYAAVKSIELFQAQVTGNMRPASLSAQNIIDCAGRSNGCRNQVPQTAFDYLTQHNRGLLLESVYKNNNALTEPGMCVPNGISAANLAKYSTIVDGDDETLKQYVGAGFPVVVEFNPTSFEFMHYSEGVFQPPTTHRGSHFMLVIGYDTDPQTGRDYWLVQNSFDRTWGENGLIRIARSPTIRLAKNAIFPTELA